MSKPNILVILSDQLRRQALGCHGDPNAVTPNIDALAQGGVRFTNSCSTSPICVPYRFTLMTGQYAHTRQVPGINWRMSPAERTLADEFNEAGYHTAYVGKWHLYGGSGPALMRKPVPRQYQGRWQKWLGFEFRNSFFDTSYFEDDDPTPIPIDGYQTDGLFDAAINHLKTRVDAPEPFCCVLSVEAPHPPFEAPKELEEKWLARDLTLPPNFMVPAENGYNLGERGPESYDNHVRIRKIYNAMVENLDQNVGRIMEFLHNSGLDKNTIVLFIADHGEMNGAHALDNKQYPYEESAGVPLIVHGPGCGIPAGEIRTAPTCTEDMFPTLLGMAGVTARDPMPGHDLTQLIKDGTSAPDRPGVMLEFVLEMRSGQPFFNSPYRSFRSERYKYSVVGGNEGMQPWHFFDLEADPYELNNLLDDAASESLIAQHHGWLRDRMTETGDHGWLAEAWGFEALNAWINCDLRA